MLEGANKLLEENNYSIYTMTSEKAGQYCVIIPNNVTEPLNMLIDLHKKELFDAVANSTKTKEDLTTELKNEYEKVKLEHPSSMLIFPMVEENTYLDAVNNNDKQKMIDETGKVRAITSELYGKLQVLGIEKQKIKNQIMIVENKEEDKKYISWLKEQMPDPSYVEGIPLQDEKKEETPIASTDIFGSATTETPVASETPTVEEEKKEESPIANMDVFGPSEPTEAPAPVVEEKEETPVAPEVPAEAPVASTDIFGSATTETPTVPETPATEEKKEGPSNEEAGLFGTTAIPTIKPTEAPAPAVEEPKVEQPAAPEEKQEDFFKFPSEPEPAPQEQSDKAEEPKPLENVELHTGETTAIPTIPTTEAPTEAPVQTQGPVLVRKKGNGFANLAILLVILVVVTIISIEFGKFLYSVYGA